MSHQRYPSIDPLKEPHSVSLKVLRLSRPSLVTQHPLPAPALSNQDQNATTTQPMPASLAYNGHSSNESDTTNPAPFLLTPILNLPPSFGSAYVGETFSCTLCANHDVPPAPDAPTPTQQQQQQDQLQTAAAAPRRSKYIRDVRIEAEMKTPGSGSAVQKLVLGPRKHSDSNDDDHHQDEDKANKEEETETETETDKGTDLEPGQTLQRIVSFDLKEEGNHVLAVTVSYYEATETSGRTRTFRKLYQFICKGSLIVRTKVSSLPRLLVPPAPSRERGKKKKGAKGKGEGEGEEGIPKRTLRSWAMEAQLENCSEDIMQLERVGLDLEPGLRYVDCNWEINGGGGRGARKPVLHPGEIEQCCFVVLEDDGGGGEELAETEDGRILFGVLGIGWRSEMGNKGFLSTGKLGTRVAR